MYVYVYTVLVQAYQPVVQCHTCNKQYCTCDNGTSNNNNNYYFVRFTYTVAIYRPDLRDTGSMVEMDTGSMVVTDTGSMVVMDTGLMPAVLRACHNI